MVMNLCYSQVVEVVHALCQAADCSKETNVYLLISWQLGHLCVCVVSGWSCITSLNGMLCAYLQGTPGLVSCDAVVENFNDTHH